MKLESVIKYTENIINWWMPQKIQYDDIPGISIGIIHKGKVLYQKGFGYADIKNKKKINTESLFRVASMSKMFTAVALLQLQEQGKLKLDDPVSMHLLWFKGKNKIGDLRKVTIQHILSHTSGLFRDGSKSYWHTHSFPKKLKGTISSRSIVFKHSEQFKYSNHAYAILGEVIKKVSGLSYEEYVAKNIIETLDMKSTYPDLEPKALKHLARGYGRVIPGKKGREIFPYTPTYAYAPATGFISNVSDLAKFLGSLTFQSLAPRILSEKSKRTLFKLQRKTGDGKAYGLGFAISTITSKRRRLLGHGGGFAGYITQALFNPKDGLGVIVLTNSIDANAYSLCYGIFSTLYYFIDTHFKKEFKGGIYEGIYRERWGDDVIVQAGDSLLVFDARNNNPITKSKLLLMPQGKHIFKMETQEVFESPGELAIFSMFKNKRPQKVSFGPNPVFRVK